MATIDRTTQKESLAENRREDEIMDVNDKEKGVLEKESAVEKKGTREKMPGDENIVKPNIATFRGIPKKLHETIKQTASELGVSPGELARYLLEVGLKRIEKGEDLVEPKFVPGGFTLYPEERPKQPRRKNRKKSKVSQQPRSYYGVPREVVKAVLDCSKAIGVTQGEMARHLFERGLERYQKGELVIKPEPIQQIATLYPEDLAKV